MHIPNFFACKTSCSSLEIVFNFPATTFSGTGIMLLFETPAITPYFFSMIKDAAAAPKRLARILSKQQGSPPLWLWPTTWTLISFSGSRFCNSEASLNPAEDSLNLH